MPSPTASTGCRAYRLEARLRLCRGVADRSGQGTVEYALMAAALIAVAAGLAAFWHFAAQGSFASAAVESLSHRLAKGVLDIALF